MSHELRQPFGALQFAFTLVDGNGDGEARDGYREVIERNLPRLVRMTDQRAQMSRLTLATDRACTQHLPLEIVARGVSRQLHDMAERRGVAIQIVEPLPVMEVPCLSSST